jgi:hypothetical protein
MWRKSLHLGTRSIGSWLSPGWDVQQSVYEALVEVNQYVPGKLHFAHLFGFRAENVHLTNDLGYLHGGITSAMRTLGQRPHFSAWLGGSTNEDCRAIIVDSAEKPTP